MPVKVLVISDYRETASVRPEAETFLGLSKQGIEVEIMTYGNSEYAEKFRQAGIPVIDFHPEKKLSAAETRFIRKTLVEDGHQILHLFNSKAIINGIRAAKNLPVKVVLYRGFTGNVHWYDPTAYFKYLHPRVDKIVCLAQSVEAHFHRQLFFNKQKTVTIHKGHSPEWYAGVQPCDLREKGIPENAFTVVCVANARPMKGIPYLLQAAGLLPPDLPIHFLLIGKNMDAPMHLSLIEKSPNRSKIHLPGYTTKALKMVKASDIFVLASIGGEATTKAVIEAMSLGVAPVITNIAGNAGLVVHEQCGLVVPPRDPQAMAAAILKLYHDRALCRHYGEQAKAHIRAHFHIEDTISATRKLYEELV